MLANIWSVVSSFHIFWRTLRALLDRLLQRVAAAVVFAGRMARPVVDEEELRNTHINLRDALVDLALRLSIRANDLSNAPESRKRSPRKGR
jgi:hypothetical protein